MKTVRAFLFLSLIHIYKDDEFIDLALTAQKMGLNIFIGLEMPSELDVIMERARRMDIRPNLGVRVKLAESWHCLPKVTQPKKPLKSALTFTDWRAMSLKRSKE